MTAGIAQAEHRNGFAEGAGSSPCSQHQLILSGHQPVYLPGIIVMAKIALSDAFMFVGHCDYQPRSWHTRNFIRSTGRGKTMLSVPVIKASGPSINEKLISGDYWKDHHLRSIECSYRSRPYFKQYFPDLQNMLLQPYKTLAELNTSLIFLFCNWLGIDTPVHFSENWDIAGHKTAMLVDMCDKVKATDYLSSPGETYVDKEQMNGYAHHFLKFEHPVYEQGRKNFIPDLSTIDLIFNCGPNSGAIVRSCANV